MLEQEIIDLLKKSYKNQEELQHLIQLLKSHDSFKTFLEQYLRNVEEIAIEKLLQQATYEFIPQYGCLMREGDKSNDMVYILMSGSAAIYKYMENILFDDKELPATVEIKKVRKSSAEIKKEQMEKKVDEQINQIVENQRKEKFLILDDDEMLESNGLRRNAMQDDNLYNKINFNQIEKEKNEKEKQTHHQVSLFKNRTINKTQFSSMQNSDYLLKKQKLAEFTSDQKVTKNEKKKKMLSKSFNNENKEQNNQNEENNNNNKNKNKDSQKNLNSSINQTSNTLNTENSENNKKKNINTSTEQTENNKSKPKLGFGKGLLGLGGKKGGSKNKSNGNSLFGNNKIVSIITNTIQQHEDILKKLQLQYGNQVNVVKEGACIGEKAIMEADKKKQIRNASIIVQSQGGAQFLKIHSDFYKFIFQKFDIQQNFKKTFILQYVPQIETLTSQKVLDEIIYNFKSKIFNQGKNITSQGKINSSQSIYYLAEGECSLNYEIDGQIFTICELQSGSVIGEEIIDNLYDPYNGQLIHFELKNYKYRYTVTALSLEVLVYEIKGEAIINKLPSDTLRSIYNKYKIKENQRQQILQSKLQTLNDIMVQLKNQRHAQVYKDLTNPKNYNTSQEAQHFIKITQKQQQSKLQYGEAVKKKEQVQILQNLKNKLDNDKQLQEFKSKLRTYKNGMDSNGEEVQYFNNKVNDDKYLNPHKMVFPDFQFLKNQITEQELLGRFNRDLKQQKLKKLIKYNDYSVEEKTKISLTERLQQKKLLQNSPLKDLIDFFYGGKQKSFYKLEQVQNQIKEYFNNKKQKQIEKERQKIIEEEDQSNDSQNNSDYDNYNFKKPSNKQQQQIYEEQNLTGEDSESPVKVNMKFLKEKIKIRNVEEQEQYLKDQKEKWEKERQRILKMQQSSKEFQKKQQKLMQSPNLSKNDLLQKAKKRNTLVSPIGSPFGSTTGSVFLSPNASYRSSQINLFSLNNNNKSQDQSLQGSNIFDKQDKQKKVSFSMNNNNNNLQQQQENQEENSSEENEIYQHNGLKMPERSQKKSKFYLQPYTRSSIQLKQKNNKKFLKQYNSVLNSPKSQKQFNNQNQQSSYTSFNFDKSNKSSATGGRITSGVKSITSLQDVSDIQNQTLSQNQNNNKNIKKFDYSDQVIDKNFQDIQIQEEKNQIIQNAKKFIQNQIEDRKNIIENNSSVNKKILRQNQKQQKRQSKSFSQNTNQQKQQNIRNTFYNNQQQQQSQNYLQLEKQQQQGSNIFQARKSLQDLLENPNNANFQKISNHNSMEMRKSAQNFKTNDYKNSNQQQKLLPVTNFRTSITMNTSMNQKKHIKQQLDDLVNQQEQELQDYKYQIFKQIRVKSEYESKIQLEKKLQNVNNQNKNKISPKKNKNFNNSISNKNSNKKVIIDCDVQEKESLEENDKYLINIENIKNKLENQELYDTKFSFNFTGFSKLEK